MFCLHLLCLGFNFSKIQGDVQIKNYSKWYILCLAMCIVGNIIHRKYVSNLGAAWKHNVLFKLCV